MCNFFLTESTYASLRATLNVNAKFVTTTCDVNVPETYNLGELLPGETVKHGSFNINIICSSNNKIKTALVASTILGSTDKDQTKTQLLINGKKNGTLLWLLDENGNTINLTGDTNAFFCEDVTYGNRACAVTPVTETHSKDNFGVASAIIRFHIIYL